MFCTRACQFAWQRANGDLYGAKPKVSLTCANCGTTYLVVPSRVRAKHQSFCSSRCAALTRSPIFRERPELLEQRGAFVKTCERCGAEYTTTKPRDMARRRYCSEDCARRAHKLNQRGEGNSNYRHGQNQAAARHLAIRDGRTSCIICGWNVSIDLHHIVPKRQGGRISPENIAILCPNHHRMAHLGLLTAEELTEHVLASLKTRTA